MTIDLPFDHALDVRGLACPMSVIKTRAALNVLGSGEVLKVLSSDPASVNDFRALVHVIGMELLASCVINDEFSYFVRRP